MMVGDEIEVEDGCSTVLVLQLGSSGETGHFQGRQRRTDSAIKSEPSVSHPSASGLSLTLGLSDNTSFQQSSDDAELAPSPSFSTLKKEGEAGSEETEKISARGSDDDDDEGGSRKKLRLTKEQSALLEERFKEHSTLNPKQKLALAKQLNLRPRQVEVWFQNRRARTKLKQTEVDCEFLRRCCERLTEDNRRLNRELQELKAIKMAAMSAPLYMQLPPAVLKVCPSCERVAGASGDLSKDGAFTAATAAKKPSFFNPFSNSTPC